MAQRFILPEEVGSYIGTNREVMVKNAGRLYRGVANKKGREEDTVCFVGHWRSEVLDGIVSIRDLMTEESEEERKEHVIATDK